MTANVPTKRGVLFVCLGNICRSPIAEACFMKLIKERNLTDQWFCDSAATGPWHTGEPPNHNTMKVLRNNGIDWYEHRARQLCRDDFTKFNYIFGMDLSNIKDIESMAPENATAKIQLLGSYDPQGIKIIKDPYYGNSFKNFETNYEQCLRSCKAFLDTMTNK